MRRAFKTIFYIRGNYVNKNGQSSIMIRLCLDRDRLCIGTTGITIDPTLWDKDYQKVKGRTTVALQVNKKLEGIRTELQGIADKLELENTLSLDKVKAAYQHEDVEYNTIGQLFDKYISNVKAKTGTTLSETSYHKYELCRKRFMEMLEAKYHCKDMLLRELNPTVIEDYYIYLTTSVGHCNNTAVKTMKTMRTVILHGIKMGVLHNDPYLGVQFHMDDVDRGYLTEEEIKAIMEKPFHLQELEARIRSLTRRKFVQKDVCLESGGIKFDTIKREAYANGTLVSLTRKENGILEYLLLHLGRPVSQEELIEHVWDASVDSFSGSIRVHMSSLRRKLRAVLGYDPILNKVGEGYQIREESDR